MRDHRDAERVRDRRRIPQLDRQAALRAVQDGLTIKPYKVNRARGLVEHACGRREVRFDHNRLGGVARHVPFASPVVANDRPGLRHEDGALLVGKGQ